MQRDQSCCKSYQSDMACGWPARALGSANHAGRWSAHSCRSHCKNFPRATPSCWGSAVDRTSELGTAAASPMSMPSDNSSQHCSRPTRPSDPSYCCNKSRPCKANNWPCRLLRRKQTRGRRSTGRYHLGSRCHSCTGIEWPCLTPSSNSDRPHTIFESPSSSLQGNSSRRCSCR
jgi:hypothetical protein